MAIKDPNKLRKDQKYKMVCRAVNGRGWKTLDNPGSRPPRTPVKIICKGGKMLDTPMIVDSAHPGNATQARADELRYNANASELAVADELCHLGFVHSVPKCGFYLDFYNPQRRICIEIDGESHIGRERHDRGRDTALWRAGIITWRYKADWAKCNPAGLIQHIKARLSKLD